MSRETANFKAAKNTIMQSKECYLIRNYLRKRKPRYLAGLMDLDKIETIRKTISEIEVVFLNPTNSVTENCIGVNAESVCPRSSDLQNILPHIASKFIKYRKDQSERKRDEVSARKPTFLWQRRKTD
jgi:hypothetical protein